MQNLHCLLGLFPPDLLFAKEQTFEKCTNSNFATLGLFSWCSLKSRIEQFVEAINLRSLYIQFFRSSNGPSNPIFATFGQPLNPKVSASFAKSRAGDSGQTQLIWWGKLRFQLSIWLCASHFKELTFSPPMRWSPRSERSGAPAPSQNRDVATSDELVGRRLE